MSLTLAMRRTPLHRATSSPPPSSGVPHAEAISIEARPRCRQARPTGPYERREPPNRSASLGLGRRRRPARRLGPAPGTAL